MASQVPPKKNTAFTLYFTLYKNDGTVIANPGTITKKISKDGGAIADITNSITEIDTTYGLCSIVLTATEMNADAVWVQIKDDTSGCVPMTVVLYTAANLMDDIKTDSAAIKAKTDNLPASPAAVGSAMLITAGTGSGQLDVSSGIIKANLAQILGTTLTETAGQIAAAFKKFFNVDSPTGTVNSIPDAVAGANGGLPTTNGTKVNQTVDLTAGQSIACSDKTGFSLSATGADLILKSSTFVQAIVAAINELATYGLTALNTLLVTTGIKTSSTAAPADMALNSTVAKEATLGTVAGYLDTEIAAILADTNELQGDLANGGRLDLLIDAIKAKTDNLPASPAAVGSEMILTSAYDAAKTAATQASVDVIDGIVDAILADTNELQTDLKDGGRLDLLIDAILADTAELQTDWHNGGRLDLLLDAIVGETDTEVAAIKAVTDKLDTMLEVDGAVYQFTSNAIEKVPTYITSFSAAEIKQIRDAFGIDGDKETAVGGQLQTILANISMGSGSVVHDYTVTDSASGGGIAGVLVIATSDLAGHNEVRRAYTNGAGVATFHFSAAGTYYFWSYKPPYNFVNPDTEVVE